MAIIKCKMCGGNIEVNADKTYGTCDSCGSTMTFPKVSDEQRANLFNRANHFRRQNEFDKAVSAYERILDEDNTDAEAHWGVVLSRYGIEYVEDPVTHERIPTCHRVQATSILTDDDYLMAKQYAPDSYSAHLYEEEAQRIAEIQKGILTISSKEKPYDVFICYKESTDGGMRTKDSTIAQDIYYQLKQEGFNVFFARITLEDKLGQQYEPYIFAALNSAKVMLVVGTKPEHFNAVWVKNEWSRYLAIMKKDRSRLLIPCYRDMDPYDLPEELSALQSQDMSKIGFMQDLIRGIKKLVGTNEQPQTVVHETVVAGAQVAPLLRRAFMFLEDGDWQSADEYCEKVLDIDPENAEAYVGKLMAELRVKTQAALPDCKEPFNTNAYYQKALRFANANLKAELQGYIEHINTRNENNRLEGIYTKASQVMKTATSEENYKEAAELFVTIRQYKDAAELQTVCVEKAEICRKDAEYSAGKSMMRKGDINGYEFAIRHFKKIPGWKDIDALIAECENKIEDLKATAEADRLARERAAEQARIKAAEEARKRKQRNIILAVLAIVAVTAFFVVTKVIIPNQKYDAAMELMAAGKYEEAYEAFVSLNGHKDSAAKAESIFNKAMNERRAKASVGSYITFGTYEQDNNTSNGKEDIEWLVLAKENNRLLVISCYALDAKPYNEKNTDVTWETCTLRKWLNNDFLNAAFSSTEKAMIPTVTVSADKNPDYSIKPGNATQDKIFLLSIPEVNKYFTSDSARQCKPTAYAEKQGASTNYSGICMWWLRLHRNYQCHAVYVACGGGVFERGRYVDYGGAAVRPALWIDLN